MTTQQIRFFLETARCLSFTKAAQQLFVSQPTLSKHIVLLENELGIKLFYRNTHTVTLTPAGALLRTELTKVETSLSTAIDHARRVEQASDGNISIGLLDVINPDMFAANAVRRFQSQYPNVNVDVRILGFSALREGLQSGYVDAVFTKEFDLSSLDGLFRLPVYPVTPCILIPSSHPLSQNRIITIDSLRDESFIVLELGECPPHIQTLVDLCGRAGFYPKIAKYANSNMARIFYVSEGYGVTLMDGELPIPAWARVVSIPVKPPANTFQSNCIILACKENALNPTVKLFVESVQTYLQELGLPSPN